MKCYKQLSAADRQIISKLRAGRMSIRSIASVVGVAHSTISRELRRNRSAKGGYFSKEAQKIAKQRKATANRATAKLKQNHCDYIIERLKATLSPEQIASEFPARFQFSISPKAIYEYIYRHDSETLKNPLRKYLRVRRNLKRTKWRFYRGPIKETRPMISERPEEADNRSSYGHWEMDLFVGPRKSTRTALVLLERKSRYSIVRMLSNRTQKAVHEALNKVLAPFSVKTITTDNGVEFLDHKTMARLTNSSIYYCNPYRAWEKGAVENVIGLYREFFPKATSLPGTQEPFEAAQLLINSRPKKALGFKSPLSLIDKINKP